MTGTGSPGWTTAMAGRWLRITETTADGGGDGYWYEIASVTNSTTLELKKPYQGTTIAAATAAYTMGLITYEPEPYQMAPIYRAVAQYWDTKENLALSTRCWNLYDGGFEAGNSDEPRGLIGQMLQEEGESMEGPYLPPLPRGTNVLRNWPAYYYPWDNASGF